MKTKHQITAPPLLPLVFRLGVALGLLLSTGAGAGAAPLRADPRTRSAISLEQASPESVRPRAAAPAPPEGLSSDAWGKILAQVPQGRRPLATSSLEAFEAAKLLADDGAPADGFGYAVAVSGDTAVVGAYLDDDDGSGSGSAYVFARNQGGADAWGQVAKLTASDGAANDYFGYAVGLSGDTIVVGAHQDDDDGTNSGSVYIFERNQGGADTWGQVAKLAASDAVSGAEFGCAVAIAGDTVVVGARSSSGHSTSSGSAYIFYRNQGGADAWGQVTKLTASDGAQYDQFGHAVAISGDAVVVGAYLDDDAGSGSGSAYVFARNQGGADAWGQVAKLTASDGAADDQFGRAVDISQDTVVVGAYGNDDNGNASGSAYVFGRNQGGADTWGQVAKLLASDGEASDFFGLEVGIAGDAIVIGAYGDNDNGANSGAAYVFERNEGGAEAWGQAAKLAPSDNAAEDCLGYAVALSDKTIVVGAFYDDDNGAESGSAYVFVRTGNTWEQTAKPTADDGAAADYFGYAAAVSGDTAVVGAYGYDTFSGAAYVFERNTDGADAWGQVAQLTADYPAAGDYFGYAVDISGDTIVVGAYGDSDIDWSSGAIYVFERNQGGTDAWGQVTQLVASDGAGGDLFGYAVAISGDTLVVGAPQDENAGVCTGSAYVFERNQDGADAWGQVAKLTASDGAIYDYFGEAVDMSGDTVVIGARGNDAKGLAAGAAYVFTRNQGGADAWGQTAKLTASDGATFDWFGQAVASDQDTVFIGAYHDDGSLTAYGSVYVFERNEGGAEAWGQVAKIEAPGGATYDCFSCALDASGDRLVVGASDDDSSGVSAGAVYVFERNEGGAEAWGQVAQITASDAASGDEFGSAVAIDGGAVVAGADQDDDLGSASGSAYVYYWDYAQPADLAISKSVTPSSVAPGERITYTLAFSNTGDSTATGVVITDVIPAGVLGASVTASGPAITPVVGSRYVWSVSDLAAGARGVITVTGVIKVPTAAGVLANTATITASTDSDSGNNAGSANVGVLNAPPEANDVACPAVEEDPLFSGLSAGDPNGDALTYGLVTAPVSGAVALVNTATGKFVYTPTNRLASYTDAFTYVVTDTGALTDTATATINVSANDDPPFVSNILNRRTGMGVTVGPVPFTVGDPDTSVDALTLDKASSNTALVTLANIAFGGSGANRTVTVTPTAGMTGTALITVTAQDGTCSVTHLAARRPLVVSTCGYDAFVLVVGTGNSPPEFTSMPITAATEDIAYTYHITAADLDAGDVLTITAPTRPLWLNLVDHHDRTAVLQGLPINSDVGDHAVRLRVRDSQGAVSAQVFTVTVANTNDPPLARNNTAGTNEDTPVSVDVLFNDDDLDGDPISLYALGSPVYGSAAISGTLIAYTPTNRLATYADVFTYTIADTGGLTDTAIVTVTVTADDDPPVISNIPNQKIGAGLPLGPIPFTVGDPDTPVAALTLDKASSNTAIVPLANITFGGGGANRTVTLTSTAGISGTAVITVTVRDGHSSAHDVFALVAMVNNPPEFSSAPVTEATEDIAYTYLITTTDRDAGDKLIITAITKPAWLALIDHHDRTATLGGMPSNADVGDHVVGLRVRDKKGGLATQVFTITVANVNDPPEFTSTPVATATRDVAYTYPITTADADTGDALTITASTKPDWLTLDDHHDRTATLGGTPGLADVGDHAIVLQVEDSAGLTATQSFTLTVSGGVTNQPPLADAGQDQTAVVGALVSLDGSASSDPDGHLPLTWQWAQTGGSPVVLSGAAISQPTFTAPGAATVLTFTLVVTDALGLASTPDVVTVTVTEYRLYMPLVLESARGAS